ncbi:hypothetical protein Tco_1272120 [Tanacetum coccineum]
MFVGFDEDTCYIQDLKWETILGTGSRSGGLYLFNMDNDKFVGMSNMVMCFNDVKNMWHNILGHPADQVLFVLKHGMQLSKFISVSACETHHKAKQTREPFHLSDHKSKKLVNLFTLTCGALIRFQAEKDLNVRFYETLFPFKMKSKYVCDVVDVFITNETNHLTYFDNQTSQSPNDERRASSVVDGSGLSSRTYTTSQYSEGNTTTQVDDHSSSKGNVPSSLNVFLVNQLILLILRD